MALFRRRTPLHEQLAWEAGMSASLGLPTPAPAPGSLNAEPPGWDGEPRGEPGIHGVPRARRWDVVVRADAPDLRGDAVHFVALADGSLLVDEDEPEDSLGPLADAVEAALAPPYRAEAVRRGPSWAVAASRIAIVAVPGLRGGEAELVVTRDTRSLNIDGRAAFGSAPALERLGKAQGPEFVVRATRLEGDLWEAEASPL